MSNCKQIELTKNPGKYGIRKIIGKSIIWISCQWLLNSNDQEIGDIEVINSITLRNCASPIYIYIYGKKSPENHVYQSHLSVLFHCNYPTG